MLVVGLGLFTAASAAAALAPSIDALIAARAFQGVGGAIVTPLTLTILSAAVPAEQRGVALGAWGGISGLAVALGPLVGGAVVEGISWQWIFWLNVPIGLVLIPLALAAAGRDATARRPSARPARPRRSRAAACSASSGASSAATAQGWASPEIVGSLRRSAPCCSRRSSPGSCARRRADAADALLPRAAAFAAANVASIAMFFGMFGSIFLLAQFLQTVQGYSPLAAGLRILPWTVMPMLHRADRRRALRPDRRPAADRDGPRAAGGRARLARRGVDAGRRLRRARRRRSSLAGTGMALFFAPVANVVLSSVRPEEEGKASGANERDPRARRRLRRRGAGVGLRALRRLPSGARRSSTG